MDKVGNILKENICEGKKYSLRRHLGRELICRRNILGEGENRTEQNILEESYSDRSICGRKNIFGQEII